AAARTPPRGGGAGPRGPSRAASPGGGLQLSPGLGGCPPRAGGPGRRHPRSGHRGRCGPGETGARPLPRSGPPTWDRACPGPGGGGFGPRDPGRPGRRHAVCRGAQPRHRRGSLSPGGGRPSFAGGLDASSSLDLGLRGVGESGGPRGEGLILLLVEVLVVLLLVLVIVVVILIVVLV